MPWVAIGLIVVLLAGIGWAFRKTPAAEELRQQIEREF